MRGKHNLTRNGDGYYDPTAFKAIRKVDKKLNRDREGKEKKAHDEKRHDVHV